ncbi:hemin uptake protein HemP [Sinorhizobium medicae]|nr:hemin uptake protein HemP [Sinorhizobium medicae]MDX0791946.1 hemin uptake protein HemP [Sinorhizobium medicae]
MNKGRLNGRGGSLVCGLRTGRTVIPNDTDSERSPQAAAPVDRTQRIVESRDLFCGQSEILISHDGAIYRMKITRQGKLILNK